MKANCNLANTSCWIFFQILTLPPCLASGAAFLRGTAAGAAAGAAAQLQGPLLGPEAGPLLQWEPLQQQGQRHPRLQQLQLQRGSEQQLQLR